MGGATRTAWLHNVMANPLPDPEPQDTHCTCMGGRVMRERIMVGRAVCSGQSASEAAKAACAVVMVGWLLHSLGTCIGRSSAASMRHATGEQPWIRPGRSQGFSAHQPASLSRPVYVVGSFHHMEVARHRRVEPSTYACFATAVSSQTRLCSRTSIIVSA
jgi:hypothetical protein